MSNIERASLKSNDPFSLLKSDDFSLGLPKSLLIHLYRDSPPFFFFFSGNEKDFYTRFFDGILFGGNFPPPITGCQFPSFFDIMGVPPSRKSYPILYPFSYSEKVESHIEDLPTREHSPSQKPIPLFLDVRDDLFKGKSPSPWMNGGNGVLSVPDSK